MPPLAFKPLLADADLQALTLRQKQSRFAVAVAHLILKAEALGYEVTLGDAYRDPRAFGGMGERKAYGESQSAHKQRLAIDLNLYRDGQYLRDTEDHRALGAWWQAQGGTWGGEFNDGNHYSLAHGGIK